MKYQLSGDDFLFALDRTQIVDISPGDIITLDDFPGTGYEWTSHDGEFLENNPDDDIYLVVRKTGDQYRATGITLKSTTNV